MTLLVFCSKFIWPFFWLIIVMIFYKQLRGLIERLNSLKYKDVQVTFNAVADDMLSKAEENLIVPVKSIKIKHPKLNIIQAWNALEESAQRKLKELNIRPIFDFNFNADTEALLYLQRQGCFSDEINKLIFDLRKLRNLAVHENNFEISKHIAKRYVAIANSVKQEIDDIKSVPAAKVLLLNMVISILVHLIDTGKYNNITIDDIHKKIDDRTIIDYIKNLDKRATYFFDIIFKDERVKKYFLDALESYANCADYEKHYGIDSMRTTTNGLLALLALTNEIIQNNYSDRPLYNVWE